MIRSLSMLVIRNVDDAISPPKQKLSARSSKRMPFAKSKQSINTVTHVRAANNNAPVQPANINNNNNNNNNEVPDQPNLLINCPRVIIEALETDDPEWLGALIAQGFAIDARGIVQAAYKKERSDAIIARLRQIPQIVKYYNDAISTLIDKYRSKIMVGEKFIHDKLFDDKLGLATGSTEVAIKRLEVFKLCWQ